MNQALANELSEFILSDGSNRIETRGAVSDRVERKAERRAEETAGILQSYESKTMLDNVRSNCHQQMKDYINSRGY